MATNVANTFREKAPVVGQNFKSTTSLAGQGLRGMVLDYTRKQNVRLDPRANQQIILDHQKYGMPNTQNLATTKKIIQPTKLQVTPTQTQVVPKINAVGVGTTIAGFLRQPSGSQYYDQIVTNSNNKKVSPALIAAGFFQESGLDPKAPDNHNYDEKGNIVSTDRGLGQINDKAHPEITDAQARDPNFVIPWKIEQMSKAIQAFPNDINRAIVSYNLGTEGAKNSQGPYAAGLGKYGQQYINRLAKNLTPEMVVQLGLKVSSPEEEKLIDKLIDEERNGKKTKTATKKK
jgi:hypothetical protein